MKNIGLTLTHSLPRHCLIAVSGGCDSMAGLHWMTRVPGRVVGVIHVDHNTGDFAKKAKELVKSYCASSKIQFFSKTLEGSPPEGVCKEEFWRNERYGFFSEVIGETEEFPVVTCHTLDDCVEEYIIRTMVRFSDSPVKVIPYHGPSLTIRPFRTWSKSSIEKYCNTNDVPYLHDPTNFDGSNLRSSLRKSIIPELLRISPGLTGFVMGMLLGQEATS